MSKDTDRGNKGERDWPTGHPAAPDYKGEAFTPPPPPFASDWPEGHPARGGANVPKSWDDSRTAPVTPVESE